jgi:hypothetical protein
MGITFFLALIGSKTLLPVEMLYRFHGIGGAHREEFTRSWALRSVAINLSMILLLFSFASHIIIM